MPSCGLIPLYKALAPRKGDAASVRRQSRQRLRSERRYTPYFGLFHFNGGLYGLRVPSRDCHVGLRPPRNDKLGGHCLFNIGPHFPPVQCREGHAAPLQCTAGGLCIFHSSFFSLQYSFPCAPPLQRTNGNFPLPSCSSSTHNITNIFVLWKKHKNPRGNPKRSLIIPSRRDLTNAGKCDKIKAQRESGAFKNTDPVFGIARQDRFVADRLGTPAFAAGAPFFFRRGREENQNV